MPLPDPSTRVINLKGRRVLPGLIAIIVNIRDGPARKFIIRKPVRCCRDIRCVRLYLVANLRLSFAVFVKLNAAFIWTFNASRYTPTSIVDREGERACGGFSRSFQSKAFWL